MEVDAHAQSRGAFAQPVATGERRSSSPCQAPRIGTFFRKKSLGEETSVKNETKVNSVSFFSYRLPSEAADWPSVLTVIVEGWIDLAAIVTQAVRVST